MKTRAVDIAQQIQIIQNAYDETVDNFLNGVSDLDLLPHNFKNSPEFITFQKETAARGCGSGESNIREFLNPQNGMTFLDVGSCANLINYSLHEWPSFYYGIDVSKKLIKATTNFTSKNNIKIGGLSVADVASIPFEDNFFNIASCIGILEYFDSAYAEKSLREINRVLKPGGRVIVDFPNSKHKCFKTMIAFETYLGRPRYNLPTMESFEKELGKVFSICDRNDKSVMVKYYLEK
jgi:SAM-dependent methyltransferase